MVYQRLEDVVEEVEPLPPLADVRLGLDVPHDDLEQTKRTSCQNNSSTRYATNKQCYCSTAFFAMINFSIEILPAASQTEW